jgi:hypothetical protein
MSKIVKSIPKKLRNVFKIHRIFNMHEIILLIDSYLMNFPIYDIRILLRNEIIKYNNIMNGWISESDYFNEYIDIESYYLYYFNNLRSRKQLKYILRNY